MKNKPFWLKGVKMGEDGIVELETYGIGDYMLMNRPYADQSTTRTRIITNNRGDKELRGELVPKVPDGFESTAFTCFSCYQRIKGFELFLKHVKTCSLGKSQK